MADSGETIIRAKNDRSSPYPSQAIDKAVGSITQLRDKLGAGPFNRELAAKALGYSGVSGTSSMAIAALVHYGLLERRGDVYVVSELAENIMTPRSEGERQMSLVKAARHPKLFNMLLDRYADKSVPTMLDSVLVRDYNINRRVAPSVKKNFIETMMAVGLLENGVIHRAAEDQISEVYAPLPERDEAVSPWQSTDPSTIPATSAPRRPVHEEVPRETGGEVQRIDISHGFSLAYTNGLPFDLMTNEAFTSALRSLKSAIDNYHSPSSKEEVKDS